MTAKIKTWPVVRSIAFEEFYHRWVRDQSSNQLGRFVFMGTPFYYKRWIKGRRLFHQFCCAIDFALKFVVSFVLYGFFLYFEILFWAWMLLIIPAITFIGFNPVIWPLWLIILSGVFTFFASLGDMLDLDRKHHNLNLYFQTSPNKKITWNTPNGKAQSAANLESAVFSAGLLDEALLGLSTEPLIYGFISPVLAERLRPSFFPRLSPISSGQSMSMGGDLFRGLAWIVKLLYVPLIAAILRIFYWFTRPKTTEWILDTVSAAGFGLPSHEFNDAIIEPKKELDIPHVFEDHEATDLTQLFASALVNNPSPAITADFDFLWDDVVLQQRLSDSFTWSKLKGYDLQILKVNTDNHAEAELKQFESGQESKKTEFNFLVVPMCQDTFRHS